ncbi:MAG: von Willebrand factor type A domain-containing protein [Reichenbachiella sp.]
MKHLKSIFAIIMLSSFTMNEQSNRIISGTVYDSNQQTLNSVTITVEGTSRNTTSDKNGKYSIEASSKESLLFQLANFENQRIKIGSKNRLDVILFESFNDVEEEAFEELKLEKESKSDYYPHKRLSQKSMNATGAIMRASPMSTSGAFGSEEGTPFNTEEYDLIKENIFKQAINTPLSTFSIDVDGASYSNVRRMIMNGQKPYADAVRVEEMINYFSYDYMNPTGTTPFSVNTEVSTAPWSPKHQLVHIGIQGKKLDIENTPNSNLVFLIDVSGSMSSPNKLPLLKSSMKLLINNLNAKDRVAIVAYAGAAGLVLPSTPASQRETIFSALERLTSGGSTAGGAGIELAYKVAEENLLPEGNNRVILATDGDFNTGTSSSSEMVRLIQEKRKTGIYLTIAGLGMGNYKDGRMEQISNAGNGNYFYIDSFKEATKVFGTEMQANLFTIAKDVKIQVEFNPNVVQAYRLVGYENRKLNDEDFNDDKVDAGELGAGHTVTTLYEIIPVGVKSAFIKDINELKYQNKTASVNSTDELLTVNIRYKPIGSDKSELISRAIKNRSMTLSETSTNFKFSASVAQFGMLLRDSEFKQSANLDSTLSLARSGKGKDLLGYRHDFIEMVKSYAALNGHAFN